MSTDSPTTATAYLWRAQREVDGQPNVAPRYAATNTRNKPLVGTDLLRPGGKATPWTVREWVLIGTARATAILAAEDQTRLKMWTPLQYGVEVSISEAILHGWFKAV